MPGAILTGLTPPTTDSHPAARPQAFLPCRLLSFRRRSRHPRAKRRVAVHRSAKGRWRARPAPVTDRVRCPVGCASTRSVVRNAFAPCLPRRCSATAVAAGDVPAVAQEARESRAPFLYSGRPRESTACSLHDRLRGVRGRAPASMTRDPSTRLSLVTGAGGFLGRHLTAAPRIRRRRRSRCQQLVDLEGRVVRANRVGLCDEPGDRYHGWSTRREGRNLFREGARRRDHIWGLRSSWCPPAEAPSLPTSSPGWSTRSTCDREPGRPFLVRGPRTSIPDEPNDGEGEQTFADQGPQVPMAPPTLGPVQAVEQGDRWRETLRRKRPQQLDAASHREEVHEHVKLVRGEYEQPDCPPPAAKPPASRDRGQDRHPDPHQETVTRTVVEPAEVSEQQPGGRIEIGKQREDHPGHDHRPQVRSLQPGAEGPAQAVTRREVGDRRRHSAAYRPRFTAVTEYL